MLSLSLRLSSLSLECNQDSTESRASSSHGATRTQLSRGSPRRNNFHVLPPRVRPGLSGVTGLTLRFYQDSAESRVTAFKSHQDTDVSRVSSREKQLPYQFLSRLGNQDSVESRAPARFEGQPGLSGVTGPLEGTTAPSLPVSATRTQLSHGSLKLRTLTRRLWREQPGLDRDAGLSATVQPHLSA